MSVRFIKLSILLVITLCGIITAQNRGTGDYIIIENPESATFYNRYQQQTDISTLPEYGKYLPLRVTDSFGTFSDGLRNYMKVEFSGDTYFLLAQEEFKPTFRSEAGKIVLLKDKNVYLDTITILSGEKMTFRFPDSDKKVSLNNGDKLFRIFKDVSEFYVYSARLGKYGWVKFPDSEKGKSWSENNLPETVNAELPGYNTIMERIKSVTAEYNNILENLYGYFNNKENKNIPAPTWEIKENNGTTDVIFSGDIELYNKSYDLMISGIRNIVSTSGLDYKVLSNGIRINTDD